MQPWDAQFDNDAAEAIEISDAAAVPKQPLVSVYMGTYKHEPYISQAIEGVLTQETDFPIELLIGEDCSTDGTRGIVKDYQRRYPNRIRIITGPRNIGLTRNFRRAIQRARGKYVAFCDGDDWWCRRDKLQLQADLIEQDSQIGFVHADYARAVWCVGAWRIIDRSGFNRKTNRPEEMRGHLFSSIFSRFRIRTCTVMHRRSVLEAFLASEFADPQFIAGDVMMVGFASAEGWKAAYLDEVVSVYRWSHNSITRSTPELGLRFAVSKEQGYEKFAASYGKRKDFDHGFRKLLCFALAGAAFHARDRETFEDAMIKLKVADPAATETIKIRMQKALSKVPWAHTAVLFAVYARRQTRIYVWVLQEILKGGTRDVNYIE